MKKILGLIPTVISRRQKINFIIDNNLINFFQKCFPNYKIEILYNTKIKSKLDLIVSSGGNTITILNNNLPNKFRKKLDNFYFNLALKNDIKFLGICHGAQYVANFFKSKIIKKPNHTKKKHLVKFFSGKSITVNSYHDYSVVILGNKLEKIAWSLDGSIEAFKHKKRKIFCIMWHPERYNQVKKFDIKFISKYL